MTTVVKLPIGDTVTKALQAPFRFFWPLAPFYLVLQLGIVGVIGAFSTVAGQPGAEEAGLAVETANIPLAVIAGIVLFIASVMLVVLTHRLVAGAAEPWRLGGPVLAYIMLTIGIALVAVVIFLPIILVIGAAGGGGETGAPGAAFMLAFLAMFAAYIGFLIFIVRAMLALPAAALQRPSPLRVGFQASKGNWWRLFGGLILISILTSIVTLSLLVFAAVIGLLPWPPVDTGVQGLANGIDFSDPAAAASLAINIIVNYFVSVSTTAFLTFALIALWRNVETSE